MHSKASLFPLALVAMLSIAGCSGVPLSTMWHFRNFGPENLLQTDPGLVRAAVQLEDGVKIKPKNAKLEIQYKFEDEPPHKYSLPLTVLREGASVDSGDDGAKSVDR